MVITVRSGAIIDNAKEIDECVVDKQDLYLLPRADYVKQEGAATIEQMAYQLVKEMPSDYADFLRMIVQDPELGTWEWNEAEALKCSQDVCQHLGEALYDRDQTDQ